MWSSDGTKLYFGDDKKIDVQTKAPSSDIDLGIEHKAVISKVLLPADDILISYSDDLVLKVH